MSNLSINRESFITIQGWMVTDLELTGKDLMVYAIIYGFSQNESGKFTGSQNYLADWIGCTRRTINEVLKGLVDKKLIIKDTYEKNGMTFCEYRADDITRYYKIMNENFTPCEKISHPPVKNLHTPCEEISHNNIEDNIEDNIVPPISPKNKSNRKSNKSLTPEVIKEEIDTRNFSSAIVDELYEWLEYKKEIKDPYASVTSLRKMLTILENAIQKHGEQAVIERMDEAMSRQWVGWNFNTMDAFDKNRPYMQNKQRLDKKPKYKEFTKGTSTQTYEERNEKFQNEVQRLMAERGISLNK